MVQSSKSSGTATEGHRDSNPHFNAFKTQEEAIALLKVSYEEGILKLDREASQGKPAAVASSSDGYDNAAKASAPAAKAKADAKAKAGAKGSGKESAESGRKLTNQTVEVSRNFEDMMKLNAGITGANEQYINVMVRGWRSVCEDFLRSGELQEHTDIIALEIYKEVTTPYKIAEFKVALLASMAAIIPRMWSSKYELAWTWFCDSVEAQLQESLVQAKMHGNAVKKYVQGLSPADYQQITQKVWREGLFKELPEAEMRLKQSMQRFVFISKTALEYSVSLFDDPTRMQQTLKQLGLRHILFQVDPVWFMTFVNQMCSNALARSGSQSVYDGLKWALSVMTSLMGRTALLAATPILKAAVTDDVKGLQKALREAPRSTRAQAMLHA
jgi:hypothetical protein